VGLLLNPLLGGVDAEGGRGGFALKSPLGSGGCEADGVGKAKIEK
jgi:hypothetical protein